MNFIDAVKALANGKCEGIKRDCAVYKLDQNCVLRCEQKGNDVGICISSDSILAENWQLVGEVKQYEEVKIKAKCEVSPNGTIILVVPESEQIAVYPGNVLIELTGTMKREIKLKVKRKEYLGKALHVGGYTIPESADMYAEWEE